MKSTCVSVAFFVVCCKFDVILAISFWFAVIVLGDAIATLLFFRLVRGKLLSLLQQFFFWLQLLLFLFRLSPVSRNNKHCVVSTDFVVRIRRRHWYTLCDALINSPLSHLVSSNVAGYRVACAAPWLSDSNSFRRNQIKWIFGDNRAATRCVRCARPWSNGQMENGRENYNKKPKKKNKLKWNAREGGVAVAGDGNQQLRNGLGRPVDVLHVYVFSVLFRILRETFQTR